jgi:hypothetical protein
MQLIPKISFLFFSLFLFITCACINTESNNSTQQDQAIMDVKDLIIDLKLSHKETSKDSNNETITIKSNAQKLLLKKEYSGFKAPENETVEKNLDKEKLKLIFDYIKEHQLNVNLKELKKTDGIGISGYLKFEIFQPDTTTILIEGKTNIWGADDYVKKEWGKKYVESRTNIKNIKYFDKARSFVRFVEDL